MAKDGLLPKALAYKNPTGAPSVGVIVSSVFISILLLFNMSKGFSGLYEFMVLLTTTTSLAFYFGAVLTYGYFSLRVSWALSGLSDPSSTLYWD